MRPTLLAWILIIFIFLKIVGIFPWGWAVALFPLWVIIAIAILKTVLDRLSKGGNQQ